MMRLFFVLLSLFICGNFPVQAQEVTDTPSRNDAILNEILRSAPMEELVIQAKRIYLIQKNLAEQKRTEPPQKLTDETLSDREKIGEYIKSFIQAQSANEYE